MMTLDKTFAAGDILSAGDVNGHLLGLWIPIDKRVIASGSPVSSVSFQSIDSNFRFFRITCFFGSNAGNALYLRFNNDSGNNYATQVISAGTTTVSAFRQSAQPQIITDSGGVLTGHPHVCTMVVSKTLTTVKAAVTGQTTREDPPTWINFGGMWANTSALINRIDLFPSAGTMYGVFALEGMRGV